MGGFLSLIFYVSDAFVFSLVRSSGGGLISNAVKGDVSLERVKHA
jgi:hypothetical protein